jgi:Endonuclease-reverse transcriptase
VTDVCIALAAVFVVKRHESSVDLSVLYPVLEICCFDLICNDTKCRLIAFYRAPKSGQGKRLLDSLNVFTRVKYHSIITGDFNCGDIHWQALPVDGINDELLYFSITNGFSRVVPLPTRAGNLLDLVLSNEPLAMYNVDVKHSFGTSDHCQVEFSLFFLRLIAV